MRKFLKYLLLGIFVVCCGFGGQTVHDYIRLTNYFDITSSSPPSLSASNSVRIYADTQSNTPLISAAGQAFVPLLGQPKWNYIMNGDGQIYQRFRNTLYPTDTYAYDRWKVCHNWGGNNAQPFPYKQQYFRISTKSLTTNVATLTLDGYHLAIPGAHITVANNPADATFDGTFVEQISGSTYQATSVIYADVHGNVGSTASGGYVTEQGLLGSTYMDYGNFAGSTGKWLTIQVIDSIQAQNLRGKTVTVQFKCKATSSWGNLRCALIEWAPSSTAINKENAQWANPLVATWNAAGTDPTYTATSGYNYVKVAPNFAFPSLTGTIVNSAYQITTTQDWIQGAFTTVMPVDYQQMALAFWSDSTIAANGYIGLTEVGLYDALDIQPYNPRDITQELTMCERYCYVYQSGSTITDNPEFFPSPAANSVWFYAKRSTNSSLQAIIAGPVTFRRAPTLTTPNVSAIHGQDGAGVDAAISSIVNSANVSTNGCWVTLNQGGSTWTTNGAGPVYDNAGNAQLVLEADY